MIRDRAVSGILLAPLDDTALRGPVASAVRAGLSPWLQEMIAGGIIVVAVALDRFRHRGSVTDGQ